MRLWAIRILTQRFLSFTFGAAMTLRAGGHIRVTLVLNSLSGAPQRALERCALVLATLLALLFAFYACRLAWQSYTFHDISTSNDATPLWLPQLSMAAGTIVLAIAFLNERLTAPRIAFVVAGIAGMLMIVGAGVRATLLRSRAVPAVANTPPAET